MGLAARSVTRLRQLPRVRPIKNKKIPGGNCRLSSLPFGAAPCSSTAAGKERNSAARCPLLRTQFGAPGLRPGVRPKYSTDAAAERQRRGLAIRGRLDPEGDLREPTTRTKASTRHANYFDRGWLA